MNDVNQESKTSAIKSLAIIGFVAAIVFFVWLAVQVVRVAPSAFRSLASIAETVYGTKQPFEMNIDTKVVNAGTPLTITWKEMTKNGTYTFSYRCTEGISAEARDTQGNIMNVACGTPFTVAGDKESFEVMFSSEKQRFTDVPVTLTYTPEGGTATEKTDLVTVVNATFAENPTTPTTPETPATTTPETPTPTTTPKPPVTTQPVPVITTTYPVSNPNGYTDLRVQYLGIGSFNESTKVFTPTTAIDKDTRGAIRFEVKNIGTKTSSEWRYTTILPNGDNQEYTSPTQEPLKPNERQVVMVAFGDLTQRTGNDTFSVAIAGGNDTNSSNNSFSWTIQIVD